MLNSLGSIATSSQKMDRVNHKFKRFSRYTATLTLERQIWFKNVKQKQKNVYSALTSQISFSTNQQTKLTTEVHFTHSVCTGGITIN